MERGFVWIIFVGAVCIWTTELPECNALSSSTDDGMAKNSEIDDSHLQQQQAVAAIRKLGGSVTFRDDRPDCPVVAVDLTYCERRGCAPVTSQALAQLSRFPHLKRFTYDWNFRGEHLKKLSQLSLPKLECLELFHACIEDDDLQYLGNMKNLRELNLDSCYCITDKGMKHLRKLVHLEKLNLDWTKVSGPGLVELQSLPHLKELSLCDSDLDDQGVQYLEKLTQLDFLDLSKTDLTDNCIGTLSKLPKLRSVFLQRTEVSRNGVAAFRKARPNTKISISGE